ncbi:hypothetical protein [Streptomyces sp. SA3_actF]|uniref:hypothetical protein n=1 Tax=Streptomyces sp. SA3_actF TaxID=682181 RepID=UPI003B63E9B0
MERHRVEREAGHARLLAQWRSGRTHRVEPLDLALATTVAALTASHALSLLDGHLPTTVGERWEANLPTLAWTRHHLPTHPHCPSRSRHGGQLAPGTPHHRPLNAPHLGDEAACPGTPAGPGWARKGSGDDHEGGDHAADITASRETSPGVRPGAGTARGAPEGREAEARCDEPGDGKRRSGATSPEARGREPVTLGRSLRPGAGSRKPGSRRPGIPDRSRERKPGQPGQGQTTGARAGRVGGDLSGAGRGPGWMAGRTGAEPESRTWN